ncbi:MAG: sulfatase-like hydrolase/transferase, partial [Armatimonadetes bacterium]|nr:sulfatase-like hydrolase/transferase [Armatimonadota bacterium]
MPMNRRQFIRDVAVAGAGFYLGAGLARGQPPQQRRLNILFIMTDQHKLDAMGAYGNRFIQTPAMDALARQSIRFENYYIAAFPCSPSRATLMTGLHPQSHGVVINDVKLDESLPTIATELSRAGYRTCWMGKWHLGGPRIFQRQGPGGLPQLIQMESGWPGEN